MSASTRLHALVYALICAPLFFTPAAGLAQPLTGSFAQITIDDPGDLPDFLGDDGGCRVCLAINEDGQCVQFGGCTFRAAIQVANVAGGPTVFTFAVAEIVPEFDRLPDIWVPAIIDGRVGTGKLRLNGAALAAKGFADPGLSFEGAHGSVVRHVEIFGFAHGIRFKNSNDVAVENTHIHDNSSYGLWFTGTGTGARVGGPSAVLGQAPGNHIAGNGNTGVRFEAGDDNVVEGNLIGTDAAGMAAQGNGSGVLFNATSAPGSRIGGTSPEQRNVISGHTNGSGIDISGVAVGGGGTAGGLLVQGNYIGADIAGAGAIGNRWGVSLFSSQGVLVGGESPEEGNLVSGNTTSGFFLSFAAVGNTIQGNTIGLDAGGNTAVPNGTGIIIQDSASDNLVQNNTVSGNSVHGIHIRRTIRTPSGNRLVANAIGASADGLAAFPNGGHGVLIDDAQNTMVGEDVGNVIVANDSSGVALRGATTTGNRLRRNTIGTNFDGAEGLGNRLEGVRIEKDASNNTIGGTEEGEGNRITYNGSDGVWIVSGAGNRVLGNFIDENGGARIDLDEDGDPATRDGTTKNDDADEDEGANTLQNFPIVTAETVTGETLVDGRLESKSSTLYRIELFGQGATTDETLFLGAFEATTDTAGVLTFVDFPAGEEVRAVAATATDPDGNTSEYTSGGLIVNTTADTDDGACDHPLGSGSGNQDCTLREAIVAANAEEGADALTFEIPASDPGFEDGIFWIRPQAALPTVTDALEIEGPDAPATGKEEGDPILGLDGGDGSFDGLVFDGDATGKAGLQQAGPCAVTNLIVGRFFNALRLEGQLCDQFRIEGNLIGVKPNGEQLDNKESGIVVSNAKEVKIGGPAINKGRRPGNVIAYNRIGVAMGGERSERNVLQGNLIFRNGVGIEIDDIPRNGVGGGGSFDGNVITANFLHEIQILGANARENRVEGNRINVPITVNGKMLDNFGGGLVIQGASDNVIGGETNSPGTPPGNIFYLPFADTTVHHHIEIVPRHDAVPRRNRIEGNLIGLVNDGSSVVFNDSFYGGVSIINGESNSIGGRSPRKRNIISGLTNGVTISGAGSQFNLVQGNYIGTTIDGLNAHPNDRGFVVFGGARENVIGGSVEGTGNVVSGNKVGVLLYQSWQNAIQGNLIGLPAGGLGALGNEVGILLDDSGYNLIGGSGLLDRNHIANNTKQGIGLFRSRWNHIVYNEIAQNTVGVEATQSYYDFLILNEIAFNGTGLLTESSLVVPIGNYFHDNGDNTGIHAFASSGKIAGNTFEGDLGDAIRLEDGSAPIIRRNNFVDNTGFGVNNLLPSVFVQAGDNWWGDAGGPSGNGPGAGQPVSAGVDFAGWRTEPVSFYGSVGLDTLFVPAGERDSIFAFVRNWTDAAETIDLTAEDDAGWLEAPLNAPVEVAAGDGGAALFYLAVPTSAGEGATNEVRVNFAPRNAPAVIESDTFLVFAYEPALRGIVVAPDTVRLRSGDSQSFSAGGLDQYGRRFDISPDWTASGGTIDEIGLYTAGEVPGAYTVTATDDVTGISGKAVAIVGVSVGLTTLETPLPQAFALFQSYPNPFQQRARIPYDVQHTTHVSLEVYDLLGRRVALLVDEVQPAGRYEVDFDARNLPSGLYLYGIRMSEYRAFKRMVLVR